MADEHHLFPPYAHRGFWNALRPEERREIRRIGREETFPAGAVLMKQRQHADRVVVIHSGLAKICVAKGRTQEIIAFRGAGELIGERATLAVRWRSASVVTVTDVSCVVIPAESFEDFLGGRPALRRELEQQLYDRLGEGRASGWAGRGADAEAALATLIADLHARAGSGDRGGRFTLCLTPGEMAGWAGVREGEIVPILDAWWRAGILGEYRRRLGDLDLRRLVERRGYAVPAASGSVAEWRDLNCSIMFVDIAGSTDPARNDDDHALITRLMYDFLRDAYTESGIPWTAVYREDRGDGALLIVPPPFPTRRIVDPLLAHLATHLRDHNRRAGEPIRLQLRVAIHAGPVTTRMYGVSSGAVNSAARLVEAPALKERVKETGSDLGVICSDHVYQTVITQAPGSVDPRRYERVDVHVKEFTAPAWIHVSESSGAVVAPAPPPATGRTPPAGNAATFNGSVHVEGDLIIGDTERP